VAGGAPSSSFCSAFSSPGAPGDADVDVVAVLVGVGALADRRAAAGLPWK
jgi:hypothetical protein